MIMRIDGQAIASRIKDEIAQTVFLGQPDRPNLAIILVGSRPDSRLYVSLKQREGARVGIDTHLYDLEENVTEVELLEVIRFLNDDPAIDGILVQLPLPTHLNTDQIIAAINPLKDVDGFHPDCPKYIVSPVLAAIGACLEEINFSPVGKTATILYNSAVFGKSVQVFLENKGLKVDMDGKTSDADLLVSALGEPQKIKKEMIKQGAVVIDIGITKLTHGVVGDLDWEDVREKAAFATPVPGGIGPMTVAFLLKNTLEIFKRRAT